MTPFLRSLMLAAFVLWLGSMAGLVFLILHKLAEVNHLL